MPNSEYAITMARYNLWQNENLLTVADELPALDLEKERGAFFGSIQKTLSHIFWGDMIWMSRFAGTTAPEQSISQSTEMIKSWAQYRVDRKAFDARILLWAHEVSSDWFEGDLT